MKVLHAPLLLIGFVSGSTAPEFPTPFPTAFSISFETNITADQADGHPIHGELYYDWDLKAQRIDHGGGSYECEHFYHTERPCSLIFVNKSMYRIVDENNQCCLDLSNTGPPPPNWAELAQPTFRGMVLDHYSNLYTYEWAFDSTNSTWYHTMREVVGWGNLAGRPVLFTFPGSPTQDYHYISDSLQIGPQAKELFEIPVGCADDPCHEMQHNIISSTK